VLYCLDFFYYAVKCLKQSSDFFLAGHVQYIAYTTHNQMKMIVLIVLSGMKKRM
jgi:hypothetical protein